MKSKYKSTIFSPLFCNLFLRFLEDSRYEIYRVSKVPGEDRLERVKVETPAAFGIFLEAFFVFFTAVVAAARHILVFHNFEFFLAESPKRKGRFVLRFWSHKEVSDYLETRGDIFQEPPVYTEDALYETSSDLYNGLLDTVTRRDTLVVTRER